MKINPQQKLLLGVKRGRWREGGADPHEDPAFLDARGKAFARDDRTCVFCGWDDPKYMEGHHKDDNHENNRAENILTCCSWCHRSFHVGLAGVHQMGFLAVSCDPRKPLPEQPLLNQMTRMYDWATRGSNPAEKYKAFAAIFQESLEMSVAEAERLLGTSDPAALANVMLNMTEKEYADRGEWLGGVRLVPALLEELDDSVLEHQREREIRTHWISVLDKLNGRPE
ncbi:hypothetical protein [Geopseudomonas aromaticivorans]